jgi:integrin alpha FG-GAP repeat containing protein 1
MDFVSESLPLTYIFLIVYIYKVGQVPQTSYHALSTPYSFFGLGRTNNYIENLFVGTTVHAQEHFINMEGVIPNSKVVIRPSANEGEAWKRELFLRPGEWIPWVTVTVVAGTILLAIIVFVLHLNEKVKIAVILFDKFSVLIPPPSF